MTSSTLGRMRREAISFTEMLLSRPGSEGAVAQASNCVRQVTLANACAAG